MGGILVEPRCHSSLNPTMADRKSTRLNSSHGYISYAVFCLKKQLTVCARPGLEASADVERALKTCRTRTPRLPLVEEAAARELLPRTWPPEPLPHWVRLLAN